MASYGGNGKEEEQKQLGDLPPLTTLQLSDNVGGKRRRWKREESHSGISKLTLESCLYPALLCPPLWCHVACLFVACSLFSFPFLFSKVACVVVAKI